MILNVTNIDSKLPFQSSVNEKASDSVGFAEFETLNKETQKLLPPYSVREFLLEKYELLKQKNINFNQTVFAKKLGIKPGQASTLLNGKNGISQDKAMEFAKKLGLNKFDKKVFLLLVKSNHSRCKNERVKAKKDLLEFWGKAQIKDLNLSILNYLDCWHYFAILELVKSNYGKPNYDEMARKLNTSEKSIFLMVSLLKRLNVIKLEKNRLVPSYNLGLFQSKKTNYSIQKLHKQMIDKALSSVSEQDPQERELASIFLSLPPDKIDEAKLSLRKFAQEFCIKFGKPRRKSILYGLSFQLFRLEQLKTEVKND